MCKSLNNCFIYNNEYFWREPVGKGFQTVPCPGCGRTLVGDIGYYEDYTCLTSGNMTTLNGCIINGVQFGQILGIGHLNSDVPDNIELLQNYPNPFNPTTHFGFRIADLGLVKLTVYDVLGKEIQVLVNEKLQPGTYEVDWDASDYQSGVYYYKLGVSDPSTPLRVTETKKMVLIK